MSRTPGFATRAIHHGYDPFAHEGALTPPLHLTSTFAFDSAEAGGYMFAGERAGHIYSRISNPTCDLLEQRMADLEGGEAGLSLASGMGAITATLWTLLNPGDELLVDRTLYGCTFAFLKNGLTKWGVKVTHVDMAELDELNAAIGPGTKVIYFETPSNPNMRLVDIQSVAKIAHSWGATVVVDNTYATPYLTQPLKLGADIVVHSATKYLGGHGDVVGGIVVGDAAHVEKIRMHGMKDMTGAVMSPFSAMLVMRGLKTLNLRMDRHCSSAQLIAEWLERQTNVEKVYYPGLQSFTQSDLGRAQMAQPGGMIAFELVGGFRPALDMMNRLELVRRAVSLGDAESLIQHPASMTHSTYSPDERAAHGISDGLIRLSVGLEDAQDILADLEKAF
tara:strand:+ start:969 stop:2144 length:1176 start_codon:yes stop_codon:yes gene_type:complete